MRPSLSRSLSLRISQHEVLLQTTGRARNNGRSTNNVRTDWGVDPSTFHLGGYFDHVQLFPLLSVM